MNQTPRQCSLHPRAATIQLVSLIFLLGVPWLTLAQGNRPDLVNVKAWRGTITATGRVAENQAGAGVPVKFDYKGSFTAEVLLDEFEDEPAVWTGKVLSSTLTVSSTMKATAPKASVDTSYATSGPVDPRPGPEAILTFHRERGWSFQVLRNGRRTEEVTVTTVDGKAFTQRQGKSVHVLQNVRKFPYPATGFDLEGSAELTPSESGGDFPIIWKYTVHLFPADRQVLTLEIEDTPAYREWRPSTTPDAGAGATLEVKASVVSSDGKTPNMKVESFIWELEKTSREPGVAINYPVNASDNRLDLELQTQGGFFVISPDAQRVERAVQKGFSDSVTVLPFDWGGWADLKVTAVLAGGATLVGKLKGAAEEGLRLPKRAADSYIADSWKKRQSVTGPDDSDFDNKPITSHKGDGLTLYEEYRGFYENGQHKLGDPGKKDLFVLDTTRKVEGGLRKFEKESDIVIHRLEKDELNEKNRVINKNRARGPHLVAQHGILIKFLDASEGGGYMATDPQGAASPGGVKAILVPRMPVPGAAAKDGTPFEDVGFAHELLHALGVRHHGDGDYEAYWKIEGDTVKEFHLEEDGTLSGPGVPIAILRENGSVATASFIAHRQGLGGEAAKGQKQLVGVEQGESSGDDTCMMRYDRNSAYLKRGQPNARVIIQNSVNPEPVGFRICTDRAGTGINAANPGPSRYGNAAPGRGNCLEKMKVSDL